MDRNIVYPGSIPLDTDLLGTNRNAMVALGALAAATIGAVPTVDGLTVGPSATGGLAVDVSPGSVTAFNPIDQNAYGSLPADLGESIVKMGINVAPVRLSLTAPLTSGTAISYMIQAAFQEADANPTVLPYYNAANPAQPFLGPQNAGVAQPTMRTQRVAISAKAGVAAVVGSNQAPTPDPGWLGLAVVTVGYGQITVTASNIVPWPSTRIIPAKLGDLRSGFASALVYAASGVFTVPAGVTRLRVTVIGGGGAGGTHSQMPTGGGGAGGYAIGWLNQLTPGATIAVTVGVGGLAPSTPQNGSPGGTSSFGGYMTATGGSGGAGGTVITACAGGGGGGGYGGSVQGGGSCGTDAIPVAFKGGDGGGPGAGRGSTGILPGLPGQAPGAGGGGGGGTVTNGVNEGGTGGNGANGIVIVEL